MMKAAIVVSMAMAASAAAPKAHQLEGYTFKQYLEDQGKSYSGSELVQRSRMFLSSLAKVRAHNKNPAHTWKMGINKFSDMTEEEISMFKGKRGGQFGLVDTVLMDNLKPVGDLPTDVDWRTKNVVTKVKNQGGCGSCWAFSATEVLESHVAIQTGSLLELSPQELVSCAPNPDSCGGTGGCQGSTQWLGFNYTAGAGGLSSEKSYPYQGQTGTCSASKVKPAAGNTGYARLPQNDYDALMNAVATIGPIAISVDASWSSYESGVYDHTCGTTIDHAVVLDGYGTAGGKDYYLVRNSWGASWGDGGYIKIARNTDDSSNCGTDENPADGTECKPYPKTTQVCGLCGILSDSSYPTGAFVV